MEMFLKTVKILLLITSTSTINAQLQQPINTAPSSPPPFKTSDFPNIFTSQPSPSPNIGVNGRGIFTGTPLASRRGPTVTLHSYPWLTYNKLANAEDKSGRTLVYNEDTSFALPSPPLGSAIQNLPSIPSIPGIPNPPKLPNFPTFPTPATVRKPRSLIAPQINQTHFPGIVPFGNTFPTHPYPQFPIYPLPYPIPYTIITQVIPVWPAFGVPYQPPPMPMVAEASAAIVTPEVVTSGEFSGGAEIEAPYPDPVKPDSEAAGEIVGEAEIDGPYPVPVLPEAAGEAIAEAMLAPYPDPVQPEVAGEAIAEAMLAPYPVASPESVGDSSGEVTSTGPYPELLKPAVSGEASGGAMIEGPYPAAKPAVSGEASGGAMIEGPYPAAKPAVSGEASGGAMIEGPYPAAKPAVSGEASGGAMIEGPYPAAKPAVSGEASGGAMIEGPYPAAKPAVSGEASGGAMIEGPYPAAKPAVSGEASGGATIEGPYPAAKPAVSGEASGGAMIEGPYSAAKPAVSGDASGGATIEGPYPAAIPVKTSKVRVPNPAPERPVFSGVLNVGANFQGARPVIVKPQGEISTETIKEFILLKEFMNESQKPAVTVSGMKNKGPYLIPKTQTSGADLGSLTKPVPPTTRRGDRVSYAAQLRQVVYPEYLRDASGRIVRFN